MKELTEEIANDSYETNMDTDVGDFHKWLIKNKIALTIFIAAVVATGLSCVYYLSTMLSYTNPGFTLDDSWIHLQFARTIYEGNPWEYSPGYPSTGSTSPLWSVIISVLFYFSSDPVGLAWGVYIISTCFYMASSFIVGMIVTDYTESSFWGVLSIIGFVVVPRNTWLMLSGMETPLFVFVLLLSIFILDKEDIKYDLVLGVLVGFSFLSRPEGIIIAFGVPVRFLILAVKKKIDRKRIVTLFISVGLAVVVVLPWILHCMNVTGLPLPDTFYAKVHTPLESEIEAWNFWWSIYVHELPFLLVGVFVGIALIVKGKPFPWMFPVVLTVLYRLTAPYASLINNSRYLVPVFDLFFVAAIIVTAWTLEIILVGILKFYDTSETKIIAVLLTLMVLLVPLIPHYMSQATYYGKAVKTVNDMHVNIGYWLAENTPEDAVFATHDAGAVRYISNRTMIDLAGLVSPDITHGNMTPRQILSYLREHGCNYFVYFNDLFAYWTRYFSTLAYEMVYTVTIPPEVHVGGGRPTMSVYQIFWEYTDY
ncbi:MAG: glycosyltransferase family 39 protein [Candidatus Thorarchaeota archaeon SMTZ1-45]